MTERRLTLLTGAALLAAPVLLRPAQAQPAAAPAAQAPGFYRFNAGGWAITMVNDGFNRAPAPAYMANVPLADLQAVLAESFMPTDAVTIPFTITFARRGTAFVVFDAGNGVPAGPTATNGRMIANMAAAGIDPAAITHVVHSHFHGDHIGGLLDASAGRAFPNAEIVVPAPEWAFWTEASNESRSPDRQKPTFANTARRFAPYQGRVRMVADGQEALPGVRAIAAPGHTPGHTIYRLSDGADQLLFLADLTNRPEVMARRPEWHAAADFDGPLAATSRRRMLDMAATDRIRVTGYHFPFPANGFIARDGQNFRFVPAEWSSAV